MLVDGKGIGRSPLYREYLNLLYHFEWLRAFLMPDEMQRALCDFHDVIQLFISEEV